MAVCQIQKLVRAIKGTMIRVIPIRALVFDTEFVVHPGPRADHAKADLDPVSSITGYIPLRVDDYRYQAGVIDPGYVAVKAEVNQLSAPLPDQTLIAAENGRTRVGLVLILLSLVLLSLILLIRAFLILCLRRVLCPCEGSHPNRHADNF